MDFLKSGLKTVLGSGEPGQVPSPGETVERLVHRVEHSTLLEDRRDACRALKALSRKYRVEVGAQAMNVLKQVLELDRADNETISYALDTLNNIMSPSRFEEEDEEDFNVSENIGEQFTEMFVKDHNNVQIVLDLLDEYDFRVRLATVQLLTSLLTNRTKDIQEIILVKPMGVSKMMDLLGDSREVIRNETLLLLIKLTKGNANIQKIVAFENAFDRLFEIVSSEGYSEGGIIVEDCLLLMLNLLKNNSSNIHFFKEGSYIQKMLPMFNATNDVEDLGWSPQKVSNVHCMLQIVRTLVSPSNSAQLLSTCQKIMKNSGVLAALCSILMASGVPGDVLTESINTVGEAVRGAAESQEFLGRMIAPSDPPRPVIVVLLMSMVNEKQPFALRCSVLYCFQCYLYNNEEGQAALVATLLPSAEQAPQLSGGQLVCGGLAAAAGGAALAAAALAAALRGRRPLQKKLLRVQLAAGPDATPRSLLELCTHLLQHSTRLQLKVSLMMLLSQWTSNCPEAVSAFLLAPGAVGYLVNQVCSNEHDENESLLQGLAAFLLAICIHFNDDSVENYSKDSLKQLLLKRIGMETFTAKLSEVSKHEAYNKAAKHPQLKVKEPSDIMIDYEFCKLFKSLENVVTQSLIVKEENGHDEDGSERRSPEESSLEQYKSLIRQQDQRLQELAAQLQAVLQREQAAQIALSESLASNSLLKDENTLLKARVSAAPTPAQPTTNPDESRKYEARIQELTAEVNRLNDALIASVEGQRTATDELERVRKDQDDLLELLADQDAKLNEFKMRLLSLGQPVEDAPPPQNLT